MAQLEQSIPDNDMTNTGNLTNSLYQTIKKQGSNNKKKTKKRDYKILKSRLPEGTIEKKIKILASNKLLTCENIKQTPNMEYVGEGVSNKVFFGCFDTSCNQKAAFRIMPISKKYPLDSKHPVNVEIKLYKVFNKLNSKYIIPHLPLMLKNFRCKYPQVLDDEDILEQYQEKIASNEIDKQVNVMILEYCRKGSIKNFVEKYSNNIKYLRNAFFQVLLTLTTLQYHLPSFRHNDLHNNNVNFDLFGFPGEEKYYKNYKKNRYYITYESMGKIFYIPYLGFCAKLIDFDVSCSKDIPNSKVKIDKVYKKNGVTCKSNPVFDTHLILNSCTYKFFETFIGGAYDFNSKRLHSEMIKFMDRNIPADLRGFNTDKLGYARIKEIKSIPKGLKTPIDVIMEDPLFAKYQEKPKSGKVIMHYDTKIPNLTKLRKLRPEMFI